MLKLSGKYQCSGCAACADVCPVHCIEYKRDALGFIYPEIDAKACINCGACERVCPIKPENVSVREPETCYAAWAKNENIHLASSSGGLGYLLAEAIIDRGGIVYGCAAENPLHISHIRVDEKSALSRLQGSKYVQSETRGIYKQLKADIRNGKDVLFIGTPCQVSAVNNLFKKSPDNLYIVDLICHGVPSQKMLNAQIAGISDEKPESISLRNGNDFRLKLTYSDSREFSKPVWSIPYYRMFLAGYSYRPSCYKCPYAGAKRVGDITIGDFWGIKNPEALPNESLNGISAVLVSTAKGQRLLDTIKPRLDIQKRPVKEAVDGNDQLQHPVKYTFRAKLFRTLYPTLPLRVAATLCVADKKFVTMLRIIAKKLKA